MRKIIILLLALVLAACGAPAAAPTQQAVVEPVQPSATPVVLVETVIVTVVPTLAPTDIPAPTQPPPTSAPPPTEVVAAPPTEAAPPDANAGLITIDDALGKGWFLNMTRNRNDFSLRCQLNKEITFSVKATSTDITQVDLWYRTEDRDTGAIFEWQNAGRMIPDNTGNFTIVFSGEKVNANIRKPNAWFDYQFVGYNANGVVGRSEKIERQVSYTFECP